MGLGDTATIPSAAFTPGAWEASRDQVLVSGKGTVTAVKNPWNNQVEREANARLIAAAPELYEALRKCLAMINCHCKPDACCTLSEGGDVFSAIDAHSAAVTAINKARGEQ